jgi:urease accessory protein
VALRAAYDEDSTAGLVYIDRLLSATKLARESRSASTATGRRFLANVVALGVESPRLAALGTATREEGLNLAVAYGVAAPALGIGVEEALYAYLYSGAASLVSAGQKLVSLGGSAAQRVLYGLGAEIERAVERSAGFGVEALYAFAPELDVRSMQHERQRVRLYMS